MLPAAARTAAATVVDILAVAAGTAVVAADPVVAKDDHLAAAAEDSRLGQVDRIAGVVLLVVGIGRSWLVVADTAIMAAAWAANFQNQDKPEPTASTQVADLQKSLMDH